MRCPVCRAENAAGPPCRRCRADLGLLFDLEQCRAQLLAAARQALAAGQPWEAQQRAQRAHELLGDEESRRLLAVTSLLQRDFAGAWRHYQEQQPQTNADERR